MSSHEIRQRYLNEMSAASRGHFNDLESQRQEVQDFMNRAFERMDRMRFEPREINQFVAWMLGTLIPRILPGAWGGMVPPITVHQRHKTIDRYMAVNQWLELSQKPVVLDLGCGFPPVTTIELAERYPTWQIVGADPSFEPYLVYDGEGNYAFFNEAGELRYFQTEEVDINRWDELLSDPGATSRRFAGMFDQLRGELNGTSYPATVRRNGARLVFHPLAEFQKPNLCFTKGAFGDVDVSGVDAIRSFNVLCYFDRAFREKAVEWAGTILKEGGIFFYGMDNTRSIEAYYRLFRLEKGAMVEREFAFSIDSVRPISIIPWFSIHADDPEPQQMIEMVRILRANDGFRSDFDRRMDELLDRAGVCPRGDDGCLGGVPPDLKAGEMEDAVESIGRQLADDGFVDRAVDILAAEGIKAWRNEVGHLAMAPHL